MKKFTATQWLVLGWFFAGVVFVLMLAWASIIGGFQPNRQDLVAKVRQLDKDFSITAIEKINVNPRYGFLSNAELRYADATQRITDPAKIAEFSDNLFTSSPYRNRGDHAGSGFAGAFRIITTKGDWIVFCDIRSAGKGPEDCVFCSGHIDEVNGGNIETFRWESVKMVAWLKSITP